MNLLIKDQKAFWRDHCFEINWGRSGLTHDKREGDGATPAGAFSLREVFFRSDRLSHPETRLPCRALQHDDGWCDDASHPLYNQFVKKPFSASHEDLWRQDHVYDLIVVVGYNDDPIVPGKGSAIFLHLRRPGPTEGCVTFSGEDLLLILKEWTPLSKMIIS